MESLVDKCKQVIKFLDGGGEATSLSSLRDVCQAVVDANQAMEQVQKSLNDLSWSNPTALDEANKWLSKYAEGRDG